MAKSAKTLAKLMERIATDHIVSELGDDHKIKHKVTRDGEHILIVDGVRYGLYVARFMS